MSVRGALYVYWGNKYDDELARSIASVEKLGLPVHVERLDGAPGLWAKAGMYEYSPFDETVFLDTDTIVLENLDFGFEMARHHGVALAVAPACYAKRFGEGFPADAIEYNTGVIFFSKVKRVSELFETWKSYSEDYPENDQTSFARAIWEQKFNPFVLPLNWNLRAHLDIRPIFGPIKVWHSRLPIPENIESWNEANSLEFGKIHAKDGRVRVVGNGRKRGSLLRRILRRVGLV